MFMLILKEIIVNILMYSVIVNLGGIALDYILVLSWITGLNAIFTDQLLSIVSNSQYWKLRMASSIPITAILYYYYGLDWHIGLLLLSPIIGICSMRALTTVASDVLTQANTPPSSASITNIFQPRPEPKYLQEELSLTITKGTCDPIGLEEWNLGQRVFVLNRSPHYLVSFSDLHKILCTGQVPTTREHIQTYQVGNIKEIGGTTGFI